MTDDTNEGAMAHRKDPVAPEGETMVPPPLDGLSEGETVAASAEDHGFPEAAVDRDDHGTADEADRITTPSEPSRPSEPPAAAKPPVVTPPPAMAEPPAAEEPAASPAPARADAAAAASAAAAAPYPAAPPSAEATPAVGAPAGPPAAAAGPRRTAPAYPSLLAHMTLPNVLTIFRGLAIFALLIIFLWPWGTNLTLALVVFALAAVTDWLDGRIARAWNLTSNLGRMMDSIADKLLIAVTLLALCAIGLIDGANVLAAALILAREIAMSGYREHLAGKNIVVPPSMAGKWKATFQMVALAALMAAPLAPFPEVARVAALLILWAAMVMTITSFVQYVMETPKEAFEE